MKGHAGFAAQDITPGPGLPMGGYAARTGTAEGTLDPLQCRAAVVSAGGAPAALVALDLLHVAGPWATDVRARVAVALATQPEHVLVAATHTHSGPAVFGAGADLAAYESKVADIVVHTVRQARETMEACTFHFGAAPAPGVGASRRAAGEEVDQTARVLVARRGDGSCRGAVAAFGCHPTVLPPSNLFYSRDLFGWAVDCAAAAIDAPLLLFNGAAADVSTRFTRRDASPAEAERLGALLGAGITAAVRDARALGDGGISARCRRVPVRLRSLPAEAEAEKRMSEAAAAVERLRTRDAPPAEIRLATSRLEGALAQLHLARHGGWEAILGRVPQQAEVQELRCGELRLLAAPGEIFSSVARRLCASGSRLVLGYANDYLGYLVSPTHAGDGEYEALMAALAPDSAAAIESSMTEMASDA